MKNKSATVKSWLSVAVGSVLAISASVAQSATIAETESNDTFATADAGTNGTLWGSIGDASAPSNDVDIWSFQLNAGQAFGSSITYTGLYNEFDVNPVMTLYWDDNGAYRPVASTDPQSFGTSINFTPWASGDYFLAVTADFNQGVDAFGNFQSDFSWLTSEFITGTAFDHFNGQSFTSFNYEISAVGAVPIPAAIWLFGSGLLGLVGIARRRA